MQGIIKKVLGIINSQTMFFLAYILVLFPSMYVALDMDSQMIERIDYISYTICAVIILANLKKYTWKHWILFVLAIASLFFAPERMLLKFILLVMACINVDFDTIVKRDFAIRLLLMLGVIVLNSFGLMEDHTVYRRHGEIVRYALGFRHPNQLGFNLMILIFDLVYTRFRIQGGGLKKYDILFIIATTLLMFILTDSRASTAGILIILAYVMSRKQYNKILSKKNVKKLLGILFGVLLGVSMSLTFLHSTGESEIAKFVNMMSSSRLRYASYYMENYDVKFFGQDLVESKDDYTEKTGEKKMVLDNAYIKFLYAYGIIMVVALFLLFAGLFKYLYKEKNYFLIAIFLVILLYATMEATAFEVDHNVYMLAFAGVLMSGGKRRMRYNAVVGGGARQYA